MSFSVSSVITWARDVFGPTGAYGLFAVAFMESSFFPIPPDLLLIPLCLASPDLALFYAFICTAGSVIGACFGYFIGIKGGRPVLLKFAREHTVKKVEDYFAKYGSWAVGIAGFTPIPYKIFTIASGVFRFDLSKMIIVSIVSRGARFFLESVIIILWGNQILAFMDGYFEVLTIIVTAGVIGFYLIYKKLKNKTTRQKQVSL